VSSVSLGFTRQEEEARHVHGMRPAVAEFASMVTVDWFDSMKFFFMGGINNINHIATKRVSSTPKLRNYQHNYLAPINPIAILLPKRQRPTRPLPRTRRRRILARVITWPSSSSISISATFQLRESDRPRRHGIHSIAAPRRGRRFGQVQENLPVHVALLVARHGLRAVFGQFLHFDCVGALGALVLGWDCGEDGEEDVEAEPGAVVDVRSWTEGTSVIKFDLHHGACHAEAGARLHAEALVGGCCVFAAFAHVPWQAGTGLVGVAHVWC
jgi:hypothetical protein